MQTTYKVGDKVRILDAEAIVGGADHWSDGDITEVEKIAKVGAEEKVFLRRIKTGDTVRVPFLHKSELKYIEKVAEQVAKFKVGDKVRVTTDVNEHKKGDIRVINRIKSPSGSFDYGLEGGGYIDECNIELVSSKPTKNQRLTMLEQKVEAMQAEIEALKAAQKVTVSSPEILVKSEADIAKIAEGLTKMLAKEMKLTPNEQRKAIINEAKAFLEEVEREQNDSKVRDKGNAFHRQYLTKTEFIVNAEKRTVVAIIRTKYGTTLLTKAIAKCAPDDVFNADIGKAIALGRALGLDVSKFEKAVQPNEVVVGQVVKGREETGRSDFEASVTGMFPSANDWGHGTAFHHSGGFGWLGEKQVHIINDTEAQY